MLRGREVENVCRRARRAGVISTHKYVLMRFAKEINGITRNPDFCNNRKERTLNKIERLMIATFTRQNDGRRLDENPFIFKCVVSLTIIAA